MLINCPRCGFSQPNDQYCAQCGVDMQSYKPKEKPLLPRLLQNATFQIVILLLAAVFVGQSIIRSEKQVSWFQKITHFQGINKSERSHENSSEAPAAAGTAVADESAPAAATAEEALESLKNKEIVLAKSSSAGVAAPLAETSGLAAPAAGEQNELNFKVSYAEVSQDTLGKWVIESSNAGLYQSLPEYSAGIISDFKKRNDTMKQILKSADLKLAPGTVNSNISGTMTEDGTQMMGLVVGVQFRALDNDTVHGTIVVTKNSRQANETYPAEFDLPKGAAFFIIGAVKPENFVSERSKLTMAPFQIFKSEDFLTRKTEFVIILEPDYK